MLSYVSKTKATLIGIPASYFRRLLASKIKLANIGRARSLSSAILFQKWPKQNISNLMIYLFRKTFSMNSYIYKRNDIDRNIYIILNGRVEVLYEKRIDTTHKPLEESPPISIQKRNFRIVFKPIIILSNGDYFGDEEGLFEDKKNYSIRVSTPECIVYQIPKKVYIIPKVQDYIERIQKAEYRQLNIKDLKYKKKLLR